MSSKEPVNEDTLLQRWRKWEEVHTVLSAGSFERVGQLELHPLLRETFGTQTITASSHQLCQQSTACVHCHQLLALSAVTMLASVLKAREDEETATICIGPLLEPDMLQFMVGQFQHPCAFMRYQARRALATVLSLKAAQVQEALLVVVKLCVRVVLQATSSPHYQQEPLQLLCSLTSKRIGHNINIQCLALLQPQLPGLLAKCKRSQRNISQIRCMDSVDSAVHSSGDCSEVSPVITIRNSTSSAGHVRSSSSALYESSQKEMSVSVVCSTVWPADIHVLCSSSAALQKDQLGSASSVHSTELRDSCTHYSNAHSQNSSGNAGDSLYLFLCLVQKLAKLINTLETPQRLSEMKVLYKSVLKELTDDLLSAVGTEKKDSNLLLVRKRLDATDTVLNYDSSVVSDVENRDLAHQILWGLESYGDCCWWFTPQRIFIGGHWCDDEGVKSVDTDSDLRACSAVTDDSGCNPVLVLLLAITLKSCAVGFKAVSTQYGTGEMRELESVCTTVILSMHSALRRMFEHSPLSASSEVTHLEVKDDLDWLPRVCGDQDDRWLEALLCLLDIYIQVKMIPSERLDERRQRLLRLLDPHSLFIQLLTLTHFDSSLIIDWLTAPETCCLRYLTRYLRLLTSDFASLIQAAQRRQQQKQQQQQPTSIISPQFSDLRQHSISSEQLDAMVLHTRAEKDMQDSSSCVVQQASMFMHPCSTDSIRDPVQSSGVAQSSGLALLSGYGSDDDDVDTEVDTTGQEENGVEGVCCSRDGHQTGESTHEQFSSHDSDDDIEDDSDEDIEEDLVSSTRNRRCADSDLTQSVKGDSTLVLSAADCVDRVTCLLLEVRQKLQRLDAMGLMAYNPRPLATLLYKCEQLHKEYVSP